MLRVELSHIWKFTVNIDYDLKFCLKVKLVQRHEDRETWNLIVLKYYVAFRAVNYSLTGKKNCGLVCYLLVDIFTSFCLKKCITSQEQGYTPFKTKLKCVHESTRQSCYIPSHRFQWNLASLKDLPQNSKRQIGFCFGFFRGEIDNPPGFSWFLPGKSLQNR